MYEDLVRVVVADRLRTALDPHRHRPPPSARAVPRGLRRRRTRRMRLRLRPRSA